MYKFIFALLIVLLTFPAEAAKEKACHADGAVYKPRNFHGDGGYELVLEDLHPTTPGTAYVRLHLNLYEAKTHRLLSTAKLTNGCTATGMCTCSVSMARLKKSIDIVALSKDFSRESGELLGSAPYVIILPHIDSTFYYQVHTNDGNPDVEYFTEPKAGMTFPPEVWMRKKCGKPSLHFGHLN